MRRFAAVLIVLVAACGARTGADPAWPKSAGTERIGEASDDGGQSLDPRVPQAVAAIEQSADDSAPAATAAPAPAAKPADATGAGAPAATPTPGDPEQPVMLDFEEEIVIEPSGP